MGIGEITCVPGDVVGKLEVVPDTDIQIVSNARLANRTAVIIPIGTMA